MSEHKSTITLEIELDENKVPEKMYWSAPDGGINKSEAKAFLLSVWDEESEDTLRIDLWTKDMKVDNMKRFFHQTLVSMADSLERATQEDKMAGDLRDFCDHFAEKLLKEE
ncbi:MAG: gliding motility protein GldC [Flavobacteriales bacterium]|nr:gliding motility protein GldC [Flavobacteriales bacterium]